MKFLSCLFLPQVKEMRLLFSVHACLLTQHLNLSARNHKRANVISAENHELYMVWALAADCLKSIIFGCLHIFLIPPGQILVVFKGRFGGVGSVPEALRGEALPRVWQWQPYLCLVGRLKAPLFADIHGSPPGIAVNCQVLERR